MDVLVGKAISDAGGNTRVCIDTSVGGRIYVLNSVGHIWSSDGRLLQLSYCKQCVATCTLPASDMNAAACTFTASSLHVNRDESFLLVRGYRHDVRFITTCITKCIPNAHIF